MITKLKNNLFSFLGISKDSVEHNDTPSRKRRALVPIRSPQVKRQKMSYNPNQTMMHPNFAKKMSANSIKVPQSSEWKKFNGMEIDTGCIVNRHFSPVLSPDSYFYSKPCGTFDMGKENTYSRRHYYATKASTPLEKIPAFKPRAISYDLTKMRTTLPVCRIKHNSNGRKSYYSGGSDMQSLILPCTSKLSVDNSERNKSGWFSESSKSFLTGESNSESEVNDLVTLESEDTSSCVSVPVPAVSCVFEDLKSQFTQKDFLQNNSILNRYQDEINRLNLDKPEIQKRTQNYIHYQYWNIENRLEALSREPPVLRVQFPEKTSEFSYPELGEDREREIDRILGPGHPDEELVSAFAIPIKRKDIRTLIGLEWLNDEIINFYLNLIAERSKTREGLPSVHVMNTFFYPRLLEQGYKSVSRWTRRVDIFSKDILIIPVHLRVHWCVAVVNFKEGSILFYDSMGSPNDLCLNTLSSYVLSEHLDKRKSAFSLDNWNISNATAIPLQQNASDCGVFSLMFAEHIAAERSFSFSQKNMPYFRRRIAWEIVNKQILT